jgi:hypothetical protein
MTAEYLTPYEIRIIGFEVLLHELGPANAIRFMQQFEMGHGDYSKDRHQWLDQYSVNDIAKMVREKKTSQKKKK